MDVVFSCVWIAIELGALLLFECAFLKWRFSLRKTLVILLVYFVISVGIDTGFPFALPTATQKLVNVSLCMATSLILFSAPWYSCVAAAVSGYFFLAALDVIFIYGASALFGVSLTELVWEKTLYVTLVTVDKLVCLLLFLGVNRLFQGRTSQSRSLHRILLSTLFSLVSIVGLMQLFLTHQAQEEYSFFVVVFGTLLLIANGVTLYLMSSLDRTAAAEQELALLNQSKALQTESYRALEKSYRAQRSASHEFKHQLQLIGDLLRDGHGEQALAYIDELQGRQSSRILAANTGNTIVDAILNEKYQRAKEQKIDVRYHVSDLSTLAIDTDALVVLLANLLDNAIEGCLRV